MANETGHAKNVANFETLKSFCNGYGAAYNPSKITIKPPALNIKHTDATNAIGLVNASEQPSSNAIAAREVVFNPLSKLITRVVNAAKASDISTQVLDNIKTIAKKIQGKRATPIEPPTPPNTPNPPEPTNISASQMGFDNRIENMNKLIELLTTLPTYAPNEPELTVGGLTAVYNEMRNTNTTAINTFTPLSNARIARNTVLYHPVTGLVKVAKDVKAYVKSLFGASSEQYKQISKLKFTTPKQ